MAGFANFWHSNAPPRRWQESRVAFLPTEPESRSHSRDAVSLQPSRRHRFGGPIGPRTSAAQPGTASATHQVPPFRFATSRCNRTELSRSTASSARAIAYDRLACEREPPPCVGFRDIVAIKHHPASDKIKRLVRRSNRHVAQDDPISGTPRICHVAEDAGHGKRGLHKTRPAGTNRFPPPEQRLATRLRRAVGHHAAQNTGFIPTKVLQGFQQ